jgi:glycine cleavage system H protein
MSSIPSNLRYLDSHEWARVESDGTVTIGISDHAQGALGDLVFVEVPEVGRALTKGGAAAVVESVKAASDVYSPVSGQVIANNSNAQCAMAVPSTSLALAPTTITFPPRSGRS